MMDKNVNLNLSNDDESLYDDLVIYTDFLNGKVKQELNIQEMFDMVKNLKDPEYPLTLSKLNVVKKKFITKKGNEFHIEFVPTIPNCSQVVLIGLTISCVFRWILSPKLRFRCKIQDNTHQNEKSANRQINDKERVNAATENKSLLCIIFDSIPDNIDDEFVKKILEDQTDTKKKKESDSYKPLIVEF